MRDGEVVINPAWRPFSFKQRDIFEHVQFSLALGGRHLYLRNMSEIAVHATDIGRVDEPIVFRHRNPVLAILVASPVVGLLAGGLSGGVAGTGIVPVVGTFFGIGEGAVLGAVGGMVLAPLWALIVMKSAASVRHALSRIQLFGAAATGVVALLAATRNGDAFLFDMVPPMVVGAAWAAALMLCQVIGEEQAVALKSGTYGFNMPMRFLVIASTVVPIVYWASGGEL